MIILENYIENIKVRFPQIDGLSPWNVIDNLDDILIQKIKTLDNNYIIENNVAIHKTAIIEHSVVLKGTVVISENCFIGANAYIRGPVFLSDNVKIGPSTEIKQSIIFDYTALAHFNYVGNSIVGQHVNLEAGAVCANHYNERLNKEIFVKYNQQIINTHTEKFGSLIGDYTKVGANAVLSPGTILERNSIVKRLELVEQIK